MEKNRIAGLVLQVLFWILAVAAWGAAFWLMVTRPARTPDTIALVVGCGVLGFVLMGAAQFVDTYQDSGNVSTALAVAGRTVGVALVVGLVLLGISLLGR